MSYQTQIDNLTLVQECRKGDKEALNLFYLRFAPRMLSVIRRYVSDVNDAEDILHDGFIVAFTRLNSLQDAEKVDYWLATIMRNLSLQFLQSQDLSQVLHDIPEVEDTPQMDDFIDLATLESLIKKLPAGYQKVFRLAVLENKSHKEIAKLLGIAPNSSSSQLFHAKLMMRKLITDYKKQTGILCLLLLGAATGIIWHNLVPTSSETAYLQKDVSLKPSSIPLSTGIDQNVAPGQSPLAGNNRLISGVISSGGKNNLRSGAETRISEEPESSFSTLGDLPADTVSGPEDKTKEVYDSVGTQSYPLASDESARYTNVNEWNPLNNTTAVNSSHRGWSLRVSADAGLLAFSGDSGSGEQFSSEKPGGNLVDPGTDPENPDDSGNKTRSIDPTRIMALGRESSPLKDYKTSPHINYLPVSFSVAVSKSLNNTFNVETGLTYTYLHTVFEDLPSMSNCHWHYLGVPLKLNMKLCDFRRVSAYASLGGILDIPLCSVADVRTFSGTPCFRSGRFNSPVVWSLSSSVGVSIRLGKKIDIFLEPTIKYHFDHRVNVPNVWSDDSWGFSLPVGLRFRL